MKAIVKDNNNNYLVISTVKAWDTNKYETAIGQLNYKEFCDWWLEESDNLPTNEDLLDWCFDILDIWYNVIQYHRNEQNAYKFHERLINEYELIGHLEEF